MSVKWGEEYVLIQLSVMIRGVRQEMLLHKVQHKMQTQLTRQCPHFPLCMHAFPPLCIHQLANQYGSDPRICLLLFYTETLPPSLSLPKFGGVGHEFQTSKHSCFVTTVIIRFVHLTRHSSSQSLFPVPGTILSSLHL